MSRGERAKAAIPRGQIGDSLARFRVVVGCPPITIHPIEMGLVAFRGSGWYGYERLINPNVAGLDPAPQPQILEERSPSRRPLVFLSAAAARIPRKPHRSESPDDDRNDQDATSRQGIWLYSRCRGQGSVLSCQRHLWRGHRQPARGRWCRVRSRRGQLERTSGIECPSDHNIDRRLRRTREGGRVRIVIGQRAPAAVGDNPRPGAAAFRRGHG
jgi:hypothetical protein